MSFEKYQRFLTILIAGFLIGNSTLWASPDSILFVIRVDDVLCRNTTILPRSILPFEEMANSRDAKVTWAVIPHRLIEDANSDGVLAGELRATVQKGNEIALHGYNHICPLCGSSNHEMQCTNSATPVSYDLQNQMILDGLAILQEQCEITPTVFVPPGHHADDTTYQVLLDNGIDLISTTGSGPALIYGNLFNLGIHNEYTWALIESQYGSQLQAALANIESTAELQGYYCLLLHDYFIRSGYENGLVIRWTGELLDSLKTRYGERIVFKTVSEAAEIFQRSSVAVKHDAAPLPGSFTLYPNYPNPFNPQTTIRYDLHKPTYVRLEIFDLQGRLVATAVNRFQTAGSYSFRWNAGGLPSGHYLYQLRSSETSARRKCLLLH